MDNQQSWCVYMHINKVNSKKYIGITCQKSEYRWGKDGNGYKKHPHFYNAIQKYGWNNLEHKIIASHLSKERACSIEQALIKFWQTQDPAKGYNISGGGEWGGYIDGRTNDPNYHKKWRSKESPEHKAARYKKDNESRRKKRASESPEEKEIRCAKNRDELRNWRQKKKASETSEEREQRLAKQRESTKKSRQRNKEEQQHEQSNYEADCLCKDA